MSGLAAGEVTVSGVLVRPRLPLAGWLAAPGVAALPRRGQARWAVFSGVADVDGTAFDADVTFEGERLDAVRLVVADPALRGTSWTDYDPERLRAWHDAFLTDRLGRGKPWNAGAYPYGGVEWRYGWGTLGSYLHPQDLDARIVLAYR